MRKKWLKIILFLAILLSVGSMGKDVRAKSGNIPANVMMSSYVGNPCRSGQNIYYSVYHKLYRFHIPSGKSKLVKAFQGFSISSVNVYNKKIYLTLNTYYGTGGETTAVYRMSLNGKKCKKLAKGKNCVVEDGKIYYIATEYRDDWQSDDAVAVCSMKLNGSGKKTLYRGESIYSMAYYKGRIFFCESGSLYSVAEDGSDYRMEVREAGEMEGFSSDAVYYSKYEGIGKSIYRKPIGSYGSELVASRVDAVGMDERNLYYVVRKGNSVSGKTSLYRKNIKSGKVKKILTGKGLIFVKSCDGWLYLNKYLGEKNPNVQAVIMTEKGKRIKKLHKSFLS